MPFLLISIFRVFRVGGGEPSVVAIFQPTETATGALESRGGFLGEVSAATWTGGFAWSSFSTVARALAASTRPSALSATMALTMEVLIGFFLFKQLAMPPAAVMTMVAAVMTSMNPAGLARLGGVHLVPRGAGARGCNRDAL